MLDVIFAQCHKRALFAECRYAERRDDMGMYCEKKLEPK